jgi:hypothetical protein
MKQPHHYPAVLGNVMRQEQPHQGCLTDIQPVMAGVKTLPELFGDVSIARIERDFFRLNTSLAPHNLNWFR